MIDVLLITAVQIIIEALPISSSGHVVVAQLLWQKYAVQPLTQLPEFFDHLLHGPTVLIIGVVFFKEWYTSACRLVVAWWALLRKKRQLTWSERRLSALFGRVFWFMCAADALTAVAYGLKGLLGDSASLLTGPRVIVVTLSITALSLLSLLVIERKKYTERRLTLGSALLLGATQGIAYFFTGISRFGATYVAGRWLRLSPRRAFQFSFLMQFPLIAAAFLINGIRGMAKAPHLGAFMTPSLLATVLGATVIAGLLFAGVYRLALARRLGWFGVYLLVPIVVLVLLL